MLRVSPYTYIHISQISNLYTPDNVLLTLLANNTFTCGRPESGTATELDTYLPTESAQK